MTKTNRKTPAVTAGNANSVLTAFARWLNKWNAETMGPKPTAQELTLALQTGAKAGTGAAMVRALLFRKDGAHKKQRDAVMTALGQGPCENQGTFGDARRGQWQDGADGVTPGQYRKVTVGTAVIGLTQVHGRSHWHAKVLVASTGKVRTVTPAPDAKGKAKAPAKGKPVKAKGKVAPKAKAPVVAPAAPEAKAA